MRVIRSRDNRAELRLRKFLWKQGLRYRLYDGRLPGKPDIVFRRSRVVIFVDGDYWHGRVLRERGTEGLRELIRGDRFEYWRERFEQNINRDDRVTAKLESLGWKVIRVWELEVLADLEAVAARIGKSVRDHSHPAENSRDGEHRRKRRSTS